MVAFTVSSKQEIFVRWIKILYWLTVIPTIIAIYVGLNYPTYGIGVVFLSVSPIVIAMGVLQYKFEIATNEMITKFWYGQEAKNLGILSIIGGFGFMFLGLLLLYFASTQ